MRQVIHLGMAVLFQPVTERRGDPLPSAPAALEGPEGARHAVALEVASGDVAVLVRPDPPAVLEPAGATPAPVTDAPAPAAATAVLTAVPEPPRAPAAALAGAAPPLPAESPDDDTEAPRVLLRAGSSQSWITLLMSPGLYRRMTQNRTMDLAFLLGISGVFLVNALVAIVAPAGFVDLVAHSPASALLQTPAGPLIPGLIAMNDFLIGAAVLAVLKLRALRRPVLAWAGAWLLLVTILKIFAL